MTKFTVQYQQELLEKADKLYLRKKHKSNIASALLRDEIDKEVIKKIIRSLKPSVVNGTRHDRPILRRKPK